MYRCTLVCRWVTLPRSSNALCLTSQTYTNLCPLLYFTDFLQTPPFKATAVGAFFEYLDI